MDIFISHFVACLCVLAVGQIDASMGKPTFKARVTQNGLNYGRDLALDVLMVELTKVEIPEVREPIGPARVVVKGIKIDAFPRPESTVTPMEGSKIRWSATDLHPHISASYEAYIKMGFIKFTKKGSVIAEGKDMHFTLDAQLGRDGSLKPTVSVISCNAGGDISFKFKGGLDSVLNLGAKVFRKRIKSLIMAQICSIASSEINDKLAWALSQMMVSEVIKNDYEFHFGLLQFPITNENGIETRHKGAVYLLPDREEPPYEIPPIPEFPEHSEKMVYAYVTDYLVNSALFALYRNGIMKYNLTTEKIPDDMKDYFKVNCGFFSACIGRIFGEIDEPDADALVNLDIYAESPPVVSFQGANVSLSAKIDMDLFVVTEAQRKFQFTINATLDAHVRLIVENYTVFYEMYDLRPNFDVKNSVIGPVTIGFFSTGIIEIANSQFIAPKIMDLGYNGFPIPEIPDLQFYNSELMNTAGAEGVLVVGTDLRYTKEYV